MNAIKLTKFSVLTAAALGLLAVQSVKATITCRTSQATYFKDCSKFEQSHGSNLGDLVCKYNKDNECAGVLHTEYKCSDNLKTIEHCGSESATTGNCVVIKDGRGGCYVWNICDWDGKEEIDCKIGDRRFDCKEIEVYGKCGQKPDCNPPPTCVPEPSTVVAGALLLIPLGVQGIRQFRKRKLTA